MRRRITARVRERMKIKQRLEFSARTGGTAAFVTSISSRRQLGSTAQRRFAIELDVELEKPLAMSTHHRELPKIPQTLARFASRAITFRDPERALQAMYDVENTTAVWLEIINTLHEAKLLLAEARAYKDSEPLETDTGETAEYRRYHAHFKKMQCLNLAVFDLIKLQGLIARLLFEGFGGRLITVDKSKDDWESDIRFGAAKKSLEGWLASGRLRQREYDKIHRRADAADTTACSRKNCDCI